MADLIDVASGFGVEHRKARLKIDQLIEWEPNLRADTFIRTSMLVQQPNGGTRSEDSYKMTHGGFMRLVTQFEGEKQAKVIGAWVDDYQRMKAMLKRGGTPGLDAEALATAIGATMRPAFAGWADQRHSAGHPATGSYTAPRAVPPQTALSADVAALRASSERWMPQRMIKRGR